MLSAGSSVPKLWLLLLLTLCYAIFVVSQSEAAWPTTSANLQRTSRSPFAGPVGVHGKGNSSTYNTLSYFVAGAFENTILLQTSDYQGFQDKGEVVSLLNNKTQLIGTSIYANITYQVAMEPLGNQTICTLAFENGDDQAASLRCWAKTSDDQVVAAAWSPLQLPVLGNDSSLNLDFEFLAQHYLLIRSDQPANILVDVRDGTLLWSVAELFQNGSQNLGLSNVFTTDNFELNGSGRVYFSDMSNLYAYNLTLDQNSPSATLLWKKPVSFANPYLDRVILDSKQENNLILLVLIDLNGDDYKGIEAYDADSGQALWKDTSAVSGNTWGRVALGSQNTIYVADESTLAQLSYTRDNVSVTWTRTFPPSSSGSNGFAVVDINDSIYLCTCDQKLRGLSSNGSIIFTADASCPEVTISSYTSAYLYTDTVVSVLNDGEVTMWNSVSPTPTPTTQSPTTRPPKPKKNPLLTPQQWWWVGVGGGTGLFAVLTLGLLLYTLTSTRLNYDPMSQPLREKETESEQISAVPPTVFTVLVVTLSCLFCLPALKVFMTDYRAAKEAEKQGDISQARAKYRSGALNGLLLVLIGIALLPGLLFLIFYFDHIVFNKK